MSLHCNNPRGRIGIHSGPTAVQCLGTKASIEPEVGHTPLYPSHGGGLCRFVSENDTWGSGNADTPAPSSSWIIDANSATPTDSEGRPGQRWDMFCPSSYDISGRDKVSYKAGFILRVNLN